MKLDSIFLIFVFGLVGLAGTASGWCLVKNTANPKVLLYTCFMSTDYLVDVKTAPIDIPRLFFVNSKITVLRNGSFTRLGKHLERLAFLGCDTEDIEDNAFQGLTKLDTLALGGNKLRVLKSAWFKGLPNLKNLALVNNGIKIIEDDFFSTLPPLDSLDLTMNEITCFPTNSLGNFRAKNFDFRDNRLTLTCQALIMNALKERNILYNRPEGDSFDSHYDVIKMCVDKLPKSQQNEEFLSKCVEKTTRDFLPAKGDYTVKQVCELLKNTPSPFLDCTSV